MTAFRTLDQADVKGKRVLVRVDLNVPMENGRVTDATRIERVLPTIREIADKGGKVILLAHFGRPKGRDPKESLKPVAEAVAKHLDKPVAFADDCIGEAAAESRRRPEGRRRAAPRKHPLPRGRGEERPGLRQGAGDARRSLCQRRLLGRAPGPRLDGGPRPRAARLCRPHHAGGARRPDQGPGGAQAPGRRHRRRRQGLDQDRPARKPRHQGRCPRHRRRHGQHLPARHGPRRRQVARREGSRGDGACASSKRRANPTAPSSCPSTASAPTSSRRARTTTPTGSTRSPRTR